MADALPEKLILANTRAARRSSPRWWFAAGFTTAFLFLLLLVDFLFYSGSELIECRLWEFYFREIRMAFVPAGTLPVARSGTSAFGELAIHVTISCLMGGVTLCVGAIRSRSSE